MAAIAAPRVVNFFVLLLLSVGFSNIAIILNKTNKTTFCIQLLQQYVTVLVEHFSKKSSNHKLCISYNIICRRNHTLFQNSSQTPGGPADPSPVLCWEGKSGKESPRWVRRSLHSGERKTLESC